MTCSVSDELDTRVPRDPKLPYLPWSRTTFLDLPQGSDQGSRLAQTLKEHCSLQTLKGSHSKVLGGRGPGSQIAQVQNPSLTTDSLWDHRQDPEPLCPLSFSICKMGIMTFCWIVVRTEFL